MWPLSIIFIMQAIITMAIYAIPVIIPVAAIDIGLNPESVGFLVTITYAISTVTGLFCQAMITRFGSERLFQLLLIFTAASVLVLISASIPAAIAAAVLLGFASGPMNPTGSYILAKVVPVNRRGLVFSLKQCATPFGGILAGVILPTLMLRYGWKPAMLLIPLLAVVMIVLAPLGRLGKREVQANPTPFSILKTLRSLSVVTRGGPVRDLTIASTCLAAAQMALATYLVVYLWQEVGLNEAAAGLVFSVLHLSGILARIGLGFAADRFESAKWLLVSICLLLMLSLIAIGRFDSGWSLVAIYAVVSVAGATGNGWVGLYYAELARLAPPDRIAEVTGASQFFAYIGLLLGPVIFGSLLALFDEYDTVLHMFAGLLMFAIVFLSRSNMNTPAAPISRE